MQTPAKTTKYITALSIDKLQQIRPHAVFIDPGWCNLLYCMSIDSTPDNPHLYRYTSMTDRQLTKRAKFKSIINRIKKAKYPAVIDAERELSGYCTKTTDLVKFKEYLRVRGQHLPALMQFYGGNDGPKTPAGDPLVPKLAQNAHMNRQDADVVLARQLIDKFGRDAVLIIGDWNAPHMKHQEPIRGKGMRQTLKRMGFEVYLIDEFRTSKLCPDCHGQLQYVKKVTNPRPRKRPTGKGKQPDTGSAGSENDERPLVPRHGLLGCTSKQCQEQVRQRMELKAQQRAEQGTRPVDTVKHTGAVKEKYVDKFDPKHGNHLRVWNRDLVGVSNMRAIFKSLADGDGVPKRFWRSDKGPTMKSTATATAAATATATGEPTAARKCKGKSAATATATATGETTAVRKRKGKLVATAAVTATATATAAVTDEPTAARKRKAMKRPASDSGPEDNHRDKK
ncbi:hypothetical protein H4S01_000936 [Coemansia sp. RSA 2610]|nr:hypothetical protein H4S01_000936 [Coemansia sp. RSA 2610]